MGLAGLSGDEQCIIFSQLCNVLDPGVAVAFGSISNELRTLTQAERQQLRADHEAAAVLAGEAALAVRERHWLLPTTAASVPAALRELVLQARGDEAPATRWSPQDIASVSDFLLRWYGEHGLRRPTKLAGGGGARRFLLELLCGGAAGFDAVWRDIEAEAVAHGVWAPVEAEAGAPLEPAAPPADPGSATGPPPPPAPAGPPDDPVDLELDGLLGLELSERLQAGLNDQPPAF